jgi:hypothetical protein
LPLTSILFGSRPPYADPLRPRLPRRGIPSARKPAEATHLPLSTRIGGSPFPDSQGVPAGRYEVHFGCFTRASRKTARSRVLLLADLLFILLHDGVWSRRARQRSRSPVKVNDERVDPVLPGMLGSISEPTIVKRAPHARLGILTSHKESVGAKRGFFCVTISRMPRPSVNDIFLSVFWKRSGETRGSEHLLRTSPREWMEVDLVRDERRELSSRWGGARAIAPSARMNQ